MDLVTWSVKQIYLVIIKIARAMISRPVSWRKAKDRQLAIMQAQVSSTKKAKCILSPTSDVSYHHQQNGIKKDNNLTFRWAHKSAKTYGNIQITCSFDPWINFLSTSQWLLEKAVCIVT